MSRPNLPTSSGEPGKCLPPAFDCPIAVPQFEVLVRVVNIPHQPEFGIIQSKTVPAFPHLVVKVIRRESFASGLI